MKYYSNSSSWFLWKNKCR